MGIERIPIKGLLGGLIALGIMVMIVAAVPAARWFLLISLPVGIVVGLFLRFWHEKSE